MRNIKRIFSASLSAAVCACMVAGAAVPAYATETSAETNTQGSLTVEKAVAGHTYRVYQIFTGNVDADGTVVGNVKYGANYGETGTAVPADVLDAIKDAKEFAKQITSGSDAGGGIHGDPVAELTAENPTADLDKGYYLVMDHTEGTEHGDAVSDFIVRIVGDASFTPKSTGVPKFDKIIDDLEKPELPVEDGGTYDTGTEIEVKPDEKLIVDDVPVDTPYVFEEEGEHTITIIKDNGNKVTGNVTIVNPHVHDYKVTSTQPNCTEKGINTYTCDCGHSYTEEVDALGHLWGSVSNGAVVKYTSVDPNLLTPGSYRPGNEYTVNSQRVFGFGAGASCENNFTVKLPYDGTLNVYVYSYNSNQYKDNTRLIIDNTVMTGHVKTYNLKANVPQTINFRITKTNNTAGVSWAFDGGSIQACTRCGISRSSLSAMAVSDEDIHDHGVIFPAAFATEETGEPETGEPETGEPETGDGTEEGGVTEGIEVMNTDTTVKYGVGDSVPFKLTATMPDSISAYGEYKLVFHDTLSEGLDYDEGSLKVYAGDTEIDPSAYTLTFDGRSFSVEITDAKAEPFNAAAGTEISVKYSATINGNAEFRNTNDAYLEYSNDPNGETTGRTVGDTITAFTFTVSFDKVDGRTGDPLEGAGFTLYKKDADGEYTAVGAELTGTTSFNFSGLAAGDYKLVETTTPGGYNTMEDLEFTIAAESTEDADGNAHVTSLKIISKGGAVSDGNISGWVDAADTGVLSADVANFRGSELPSTGGMGTTLFYIAGGCIMLVAGILIVKNKHIYDAQ